MPLLIYASRSSSHHDRWPWPGFRADIGLILLWGLPLTTVVTLACYFVAKRMTKTVFAVGMLLFVITLILNIFSIRFVRKYRQVYE